MCLNFVFFCVFLGQVIYPGKVLDTDCFRIGNIGHVFEEDVETLLASILQVCDDMQVTLKGRTMMIYI